MGIDLNDPRPVYRQLADELRRAISSGKLGPGAKLPSGRELALEHDIAPMTVQQAIRLLRDEGLVVAHQGRGVYVRDQPPDYEAPPSNAELLELIKHLTTRLSDVERRLESR